MIDPAVLDALVAAGASAEMIAAAVKAAIAQDAARKKEKALDVSQSVWLELRRSVFARDGFRCTYCGGDGGGIELHCDHITPRSKGGKSTLDNLATACAPCNMMKGARTPEEWRAPI